MKSIGTFICSTLLVILHTAIAVSAGPTYRIEFNSIGIVEAIQETLRNEYSIKIQEEVVKQNKGVLQQVEGQFDPTLSVDVSRVYDSVPLTTTNRNSTGRSSQDEELTTYTVSLSKRFRNGITAGPNLQMTRTDDESFGALTKNEGSLNFAVIVPLLKGRGKQAAGAAETVAQFQLQSAHKELQHTISGSVKATANAYWSLLAASMKLEILTTSEASARKLLNDIESLVEADERPAAELEQLRANLASRSASVFEAEQRLFQAHQELGLTKGTPYDSFTAAPEPRDDFPVDAPLDSYSLAKSREALLLLSVNKRADLMALKYLQSAARSDLTAARTNIRPQLDLSLNVGYRGLEETDSGQGYYTAFEENGAGPNHSAMISLVYPFGNNDSKGLLIQKQSAYQQTQIRTTQLLNSIQTEVFIEINALMQSKKELTEARKALSHYETALKSEKMKLQLGLSTVIDVIAIEDRYINALLNEVDSHWRYTIALLRLRYATGTLISGTQGNYRVGMEQLTEIPDHWMDR